MTDTRRMTTDRFYGGVSNRLQNLRLMLEYVRSTNPPRSELNEWVISNTTAGSPDAVSHHLTFLASIDLIELAEDACVLGKYGEQWLKDQDSRTLYNALSSGVKGFDTILQALMDGSMTDEDIMELLVSEFDEAEMTKPGPAKRHREWLQVLGYVERDFGTNRITAEGQELIKNREREQMEANQWSTYPDIGEVYPAAINRISNSGNGIIKIDTQNINIGPIKRDGVGKKIKVEQLWGRFGFCITEEYRTKNYSENFKETLQNAGVPTRILGRFNNLIEDDSSQDNTDQLESVKSETQTLQKKEENPTNRSIEFCDDCGKMLKIVDDAWKCFSCDIEKPRKVESRKSSRDSTERGKEQNKSAGTVSEKNIEHLRKEAEEDAVDEVEQTTTATTSTKSQYNRSTKVKNYVKARAGGNCEGCGEPAPFTSTTGEPYLHAHHVHELSDSGSDRPETVVALCPNCHYRVHHGEDGDEYNQELLQIVHEKESKQS